MQGVLRLAIPFNEKVRTGAAGRKNVIDSAMSWRRSRSGRLAVIHSASAGEFEASLPLFEELKKNNILTAATLFSPSGYKIAEGNSIPDYVTYLPFDSKTSVRKFLKALKPDIFIFCKHDIWPNVVWECKKQNIPVILLNANLHSHSLRINSIALGFNRYLFSRMDAIWTVSEEHYNRLKTIIGSDKTLKVMGDTRFDRVVRRALNSSLTLPQAFEDNPVLIAGSVWEQEAFVLDSFIKMRAKNPQWKLIWVPHEPKDADLKSIEKKLKSAGISTIRYSCMCEDSDQEALLIDKIGILPSLYRYANVAYVGGGFGKGVHSVLEPAVFSIPVIFGPAYHVSAEAIELIKCKGGFSIEGEPEFYNLLSLFTANESERQKAGKNAENLVKQKTGVAEVEALMLAEIINKKSKS